MTNEECEECGQGGMPQMMNIQQLMGMVQGGGGKQKKWTDMLKKMIKDVEKLEPKDRLGYVCAMHECLVCINISLKGWSNWFNKVQPLGEINEEIYKDVFGTIKEVTLILLKLDELVTAEAEKKQEEAEKKAKEKSEKKGKKKPSAEKKTTYVA